MSNNNKTPAIRFKGFTDAWEQRELKSITSVITKGTTPLDKSNSGVVNFIKVENIDNSSGEISISQKISIEEHEGYLKRSQLQENDILFSIAGTLGRVTSVNSDILPANTNQALAIIRLKECNLDYIKTFLKSKAVTDYIRRNPTVGAQPNLSLEQVGNLEIQVPSLREQEAIGNYFESFDHLITIHQRKLEKLKNVRESMLQKMFPQNGSNKPEIRFKGFTAAWEQRKLSEISECLDSMRIPLNANERSKMQGSIPYYGAGSIQDYINQYLFDEELVLLLEDGDAFDDFKTKSIAQYICGKSWVNNHAHILRPKGDAFFLFISLAHKDIRNVTQLAGASRKKLVKEAMLRIAIDVPSIAEQTKIGAVFKKRDGRITRHQRQCDKDKSIKLGLMRKLFPMK